MTLPILPKYNLCCGCHACYSACPHDSIEMKEDFEGFMYPHIDENICTECKQCEIACPTLPFLHTAPYDSVRKKSAFPKVMPNQTQHFIALENAKIALGGGALLSKQKSQSSNSLNPHLLNKNLSNPNLSNSALPTQDSKFIPQAYALKAKDESLRLKSSSGGAFSLLARTVLEQGGVVFGAGYAKPHTLNSELTNAAQTSAHATKSAESNGIDSKQPNSVTESTGFHQQKSVEYARASEVKRSWSGAEFTSAKTIPIDGIESPNLEVRHTFIESLQELDNFRRSKYVESPIGECFIKAKEFLRAGRLVLFSGVQCQIHGLNAFLRKKYPNLLTIEVICNSVPSPKIWRIYRESVLEGEDSQLLDFNFRGKDYGWERGIFAAKTKTKTKTKTIPHTLSPYYTGFLGHTTTRPSCENCFSKDMRSGADITLGDFWGVRNFHPDFVDDKGISCVIFNNANAHKWLDCITPFAKVEKSSIYAVLSGNSALIKSGFVNKKRKKILTKIISLYEQKCKEFSADLPQSLARQKAARKAVNLLHKLTKTPFLTRLVCFVKRCVKKVILLLLPRKAKDFLKSRINKLRQRSAR